MKIIKSITGVLLLFVLAFSLIHCSGGGGSDSGSSGSKNKASQSSIDSMVMWAINSSIITIYNQNVAGTPVGSKNIQAVSCPYGGTVNITGTTSLNNGTNSVNLSYDMTNCKINVTGSSATVILTLSGIITETGSFNSGVKSKNMVYQADDLNLDGTVDWIQYDDSPISDNVDYLSNVMQNYSDTVSTTGSIDGRPVSWTSGGDGNDDDDNSDCNAQRTALLENCCEDVGGVFLVGGPFPKRCGTCPDGTHIVGEDNITDGGPYWQCGCDGCSDD